MTPALLALLLTIPTPNVILAPQEPVSTGFGMCGMDAHNHAADELCHRDDNDDAIPNLDELQERI